MSSPPPTTADPASGSLAAVSTTAPAGTSPAPSTTPAPNPAAVTAAAAFATLVEIAGDDDEDSGNRVGACAAILETCAEPAVMALIASAPPPDEPPPDEAPPAPEQSSS